MIQTIRNAWKVPELRGKLLFTVFALLIFRLGAAIPVPFIDTVALKSYMDAQSASIFSLLNVMSGDAFAQATVFSILSHSSGRRRRLFLMRSNNI